LSIIRTRVEDGVVATLLFSTTSFPEKMQPGSGGKVQVKNCPG